MRKKYQKATQFTVLLLAISIAVGGIYLVSAETEDEVSSDSIPFFGKFHRGFVGPMFGALSDELRTEMHETIQTMKDEDASYEEIHEYIQGFLEENGIEAKRPELTEEQLEALQQLREDVQTYAQKRAEELGIELPENGFFSGRGMRFRGLLKGCGFKRQQEG
jgi:hypothetical protein